MCWLPSRRTPTTGQLDHRTVEQRNADALVELATRALNLGTLPTDGGEKPHVTVTIAYDALPHQISSAWLDGGVTALHNLVLLCPQQHRLVHHSDWTIEMVDNYPTFHPPPWLSNQPLRNPMHGSAHHPPTDDVGCHN